MCGVLLFTQKPIDLLSQSIASGMFEYDAKAGCAMCAFFNDININPKRRILIKLSLASQLSRSENMTN